MLKIDGDTVLEYIEDYYPRDRYDFESRFPPAHDATVHIGGDYSADRRFNYCIETFIRQWRSESYSVYLVDPNPLVRLFAQRLHDGKTIFHRAPYYFETSEQEQKYQNYLRGAASTHTWPKWLIFKWLNKDAMQGNGTVRILERWEKKQQEI